MKVQQWPLSKLRPGRNPRMHSADQVAKIAASLKQFGFLRPILAAPDGEIIAGEAVWRAAQQLNLNAASVVVADGLTRQQLEAFRITDNRLAEDATWNDELLAQILGELKAQAFDLPVIGFDDGELDKLLGNAPAPKQGKTDADATPETPPVPATRHGDVWLLGKHRVRCGDSARAEDVAALFDGAAPHLMVTDPPYGVMYDPSWRKSDVVEATRRLSKPSADRRHVAVGQVINDHAADWRAAWMLFPGDVAYVWHAATRSSEVEDSLRQAGFDVRYQVIWNKSHFAIGRGDYHWKHEACWYVVRKGATSHWQGSRKESTVWDIAATMGFGTKTEGENARTGHSTQKPVECMRRPIENNSEAGQAVYDPFLGSGSTLIAAEQSDRVCYGMEIAPAYVDVIVERWQKFTGQAAVLAADGRSFAAVAADRRGAVAAAAE